MQALTGALHLKLTTRRKTMDSISRALLMTGGITADLDPNAFGFNNVSGASLSTITTSNTITPTGYDTPTTWSVTNGGTASINGGSYASSGTISPGQTITVRGTSSSSLNTTTSFVVSIGATQSTWSITTKAQLDEAVYTTAGTYTFIVPAGVTSVSVVCVGGGMGGGVSDGGRAGSLGWKNNIAVTPGNSHSIVVGSGGTGRNDGQSGNQGTDSYFFTPTGSAIVGGFGSPYAGYYGDGGGNGAQTNSSGGNGAGGYTGNGGTPGAAGDYQGTPGNGTAGTGGAGGGGRGSTFYGEDADENGYFDYYGRTNSGNGGGVGLLGQGANGAGGTAATLHGGAGSGGSGRFYGGGGGAGGFYSPPYEPYTGSSGGGGAVRIIWPGNTRLFPSTNTGTI
jgi:hypothetical protein